MSIETMLFMHATTEDERLAILTCPFYDAALERAKRNAWDEECIVNSKTNCPKRDYCRVSLTFVPLIDRVTIRGNV